MDKPKGLTSHDVVARVRRVLNGPKVGHAGTLDPDATGVLVICVGRATKISAFLMEGEKEYEGRAILGITTDTQDAAGAVLEERPVRATAEDVRGAAAGFVGEILQVPPMYSALKVSGQKLYRLARKGMEVDRPARPVRVHELAIGSVDLPEFAFRLRCSKGTYVRTLVHDLGEELGCGGHLSELVRSRQGTFTLDRALSLDALESPDGPALLSAHAVSPEEALAFLPEWPAPESFAGRKAGAVAPMPPDADLPGGLVRLVAADGRLEGVGKFVEEGLRLLYRFPEKSFGRGRRPS